MNPEITFFPGSTAVTSVNSLNDAHRLHFPENMQKACKINSFEHITLDPGATYRFDIKKESTVPLIPIIGALWAKSKKQSIGIHIGQIATFYRQDAALQLENLLNDQEAEFLILSFLDDKAVKADRVEEYTLATLNTCLEIGQVQTPKILLNMGIFNKKMEFDFIPKLENSIVLSYAVQGSFKVGEKLLAKRESIILHHQDKIHIEHSEAQSLLLVLEIDQND